MGALYWHDLLYFHASIHNLSDVSMLVHALMVRGGQHIIS